MLGCKEAMKTGDTQRHLAELVVVVVVVVVHWAEMILVEWRRQMKALRMVVYLRADSNNRRMVVDSVRVSMVYYYLKGKGWVDCVALSICE